MNSIITLLVLQVKTTVENNYLRLTIPPVGLPGEGEQSEICCHLARYFHLLCHHCRTQIVYPFSKCSTLISHTQAQKPARFFCLSLRLDNELVCKQLVSEEIETCMSTMFSLKHLHYKKAYSAHSPFKASMSTFRGNLIKLEYFAPS